MKFTFCRRAAAAICSVVIAVSILSGCTSNPSGYAEKTSFLFDTIVSVKLRTDGDANSLLSDVFDLCLDYHRKFDRFDPESDIGRINRAEGEPCRVSEDTAELLRMGLEYSQHSDGLFDITCGRVTGLWDFSSETPSVPGQDELAAALKTVDWHSVSVDGCTVTLPKGTEIDVGGIAKGYIADRVIDYLRENGAKQAIVNLGGNVCVLGSKNGQPFKVGVQSPFEHNGTLGYLKATDCSVVTAGSYQRCFELDNSLYHHILDLSTGMPSDSDLVSVTVICAQSAQADALATICFLMGADDGLAYIEATEGVEAVFVKKSGEIILSSGAESIFAAH